MLDIIMGVQINCWPHVVYCVTVVGGLFVSVVSPLKHQQQQNGLVADFSCSS